MKIAITADLHLTSRKAHPERYHALENILQRMIEERIDNLIIAGDLFHEQSRNYAEFDRLCQKPKYRQIHFHVVPGNHDSGLDDRVFAAENVVVYTEPELKSFDLMSLPFLFLPYQKEKSMGEIIALFVPDLVSRKWVLIGHGDWVEGMREANPLEPGVYMPLTRMDLEQFQPVRVVLGHIHKSMDREIVTYPGSPCALDVTETGRRRFLVIDSENGSTGPRTMDSDFIFFDESIVILPVEDEVAYLTDLLRSMKQRWDLSEAEMAKVRLRLKVSGYTSDKRRLMKTLKESLRGVAYYENGEPDVSELFVNDDVERAEITHRVSKMIEELKWQESGKEPGKDQILLEALHVIYGDG